MKQWKVRQRRRRRWALREDAAGRVPQAGYGDRDVGHLMRTATRLRGRDPATLDDLDRHIMERYGS